MKNRKPLPTLEYLNELFELDFSLASGLRRKPRDLIHFEEARVGKTFNKRYCNKMAGTKSVKGYYTTRIDGSHFYCHRIVYSMFHKVDLTSEQDIDHIDRNRDNNHPSNLRLATSSQNTLNSTMRNDNFSGFIGISWRGTRKSWIAEVTIDGKRKQLMQSRSLEKVAIARYKAIKELESNFFAPQHDPNNPEAVKIFEKIRAMEAAGEL